MLRVALEEIRGEEEPLADLLEVLRLARRLRAADLVTEAGRIAMVSADSHAGEYPLLAAAAIIEYLEATMETDAEPVADPAALCSQAEGWLDRGGLSAEAWRARLAELYARTTPASDVMAAYFEAAVLLYDAAGDGQQAERVQSQVAGTGARLVPSRPRVGVDLMLAQGDVRSKPESWRVRLRPRFLRVPMDPLRRAIYEWVQAPGADSYPPQLPDMMVGRWPELRSSLAELLAAGEPTKRLRRHEEEPPDLSFRIHAGVLQPLPWELAASKKHPGAPLSPISGAPSGSRIGPTFRRTRGWCGWSSRTQRARLERFRSTGLVGPDTAKALRTHSENPEAPGTRADDPETVQRLHKARLQGARPGVIVVRPGAAEGQRPTCRGTPLRPRRLRRQHGRPGAVLRSSRRRSRRTTTRHRARRGWPGSPYRRDSNRPAGRRPGLGRPGRGLPADRRRSRSCLPGGPADWPAPVVVLDVPAPTGQREVADQMLPRDCFAADLFALGGSRAVVVTGLADRKTADLVQDVLLEGLARGEAIGDVVQRMRQAPPSSFDRFESAAPYAGTALWCNDPSLRLPTLGGT